MNIPNRDILVFNLGAEPIEPGTLVRVVARGADGTVHVLPTTVDEAPAGIALDPFQPRGPGRIRVSGVYP